MGEWVGEREGGGEGGESEGMHRHARVDLLCLGGPTEQSIQLGEQHLKGGQRRVEVGGDARENGRGEADRRAMSFWKDDN